MGFWGVTTPASLTGTHIVKGMLFKRKKGYCTVLELCVNTPSNNLMRSHKHINKKYIKVGISRMTFSFLPTVFYIWG